MQRDNRSKLLSPEEAPAPESRDELRPEAYETPSLTDLGSFVDLTRGQGGGGPDRGVQSTPQ